MKNRIIRYLLLWTAFLLGSIQTLFAASEHTGHIQDTGQQYAVGVLAERITVAVDIQTHLYESNKTGPSFKWLSSEVNFEKGETDDDHIPDPLFVPAVTGTHSFHDLQSHTISVAVNKLSRHYTYPHYFSSLFIRYRTLRI